MHPLARAPFSRFAKWTEHAAGHPQRWSSRRSDRRVAVHRTVDWLQPHLAACEINTGTRIVTFLTVFLTQNTQNRDSVQPSMSVRAAVPVQRRESPACDPTNTPAMTIFHDLAIRYG